jgi:hypothetical protein
MLALMQAELNANTKGLATELTTRLTDARSLHDADRTYGMLGAPGPNGTTGPWRLLQFDQIMYRFVDFIVRAGMPECCGQLPSFVKAIGGGEKGGGGWEHAQKRGSELLAVLDTLQDTVSLARHATQSLQTTPHLHRGLADTIQMSTLGGGDCGARFFQGYDVSQEAAPAVPYSLADANGDSTELWQEQARHIVDHMSRQHAEATRVTIAELHGTQRGMEHFALRAGSKHRQLGPDGPPQTTISEKVGKVLYASEPQQIWSPSCTIEHASNQLQECLTPAEWAEVHPPKAQTDLAATWLANLLGNETSVLRTLRDEQYSPMEISDADHQEQVPNIAAGIIRRTLETEIRLRSQAELLTAMISIAQHLLGTRHAQYDGLRKGPLGTAPPAPGEWNRYDPWVRCQYEDGAFSRDTLLKQFQAQLRATDHAGPAATTFKVSKTKAAWEAAATWSGHSLEPLTIAVETRYLTESTDAQRVPWSESINEYAVPGVQTDELSRGERREQYVRAVHTTMSIDELQADAVRTYASLDQQRNASASSGRPFGNIRPSDMPPPEVLIAYSPRWLEHECNVKGIPHTGTP